MKKTIKIKSAKGNEIKITAELTLKKIVNLDGDKFETDCCEIEPIKATITGPDEIQWGFEKFFKPVTQQKIDTVLYGKIGKIGLTKENMEDIEKLINEIKAHPAWVAKQEKIHRNQEKIAKMEKQRNNHPGYCQKCKSYC